MPTPLDPSRPPSWWREYPGTVAALLGFVVLFVAVLMWGLQVRAERRAEWQAFAQANGCVHAASRRGDINVSVQVVPTGTNSATVMPLVDTHPDVHAWRCADGRIILNNWKP